MKVVITLDTSNLTSLIYKAKEKYYVKVGVINGGDYKDKKNNLTVAGYGCVNEFGSIKRNIPARSFIRAPLLLNLRDEILRNKKIFEKQLFNKNGILKVAYNKLGILAKSIILRAFATSFDGQWAPNAPSTIARKKSSKPLIDTSRLRKSISYQVMENV